MTRAEWLLAGQFFMDAHGPFNFKAYEVADVGRAKVRPSGEVVRLKAPDPRLMRNVLRLTEDVLEWVRAYGGAAPVHVASWFRDSAYNAAVGGASASMHLTGGAADILKDGMSPKELARVLHKEHPHRAKLGIGYYAPRADREGSTGFVHVDVRGFLPGREAPARWGQNEHGHRIRWWG